MEGGTDASSRLITSCETTRMAGTPRTAPQCRPCDHSAGPHLLTVTKGDTAVTEARNLRNMKPSQTPLLGQENTPRRIVSAGGTGFEGATPHHQASFTPNPLAMPLHDEVALTSTPSLAIPLKTPLRDNLLFNVDNTDGNNHAGAFAAPYPYRNSSTCLSRFDSLSSSRYTQKTST